MAFVVVKFIVDDSVEIILNSWIFKKSEVLLCYWPNTGARQKVNKKEPPSKNWSTYAIEIIAETDSMDQAFRMLTRAEMTDNVESEEELVTRSRKRNARYFHSDDDDVEPIFHKKRKTFHSNANDESRSSLKAPPTLDLNMPLSGSLGFRCSTSPTNSYHDIFDFSEKSSTNPAHSALDVDLSTPRRHSNEHASNNRSNTSATTSSLENEVRRLRLTHYEIKNIVLANQSALKQLKKDSNSHKETLEVLPEQFPKFPISSMENFNALETLLHDDENEKLMISYLLKAGSSDSRKCVKSMLNFALSLETAKMFNWSGQRSNKHPMKNKLFVKVLADAVQVLHTTATQESLSNEVKDCLKYADRRLKLLQQNQNRSTFE